MNIFALLSLCSAIICIALGASIFFQKKKTQLNLLFVSILLFNACWAFSEFMMREATDVQTLWGKVMAFTPLILALLVHFVLVYTENKYAKNKIIIILLYLSALVLSFIDLSTNLVSDIPVLTAWGYSYAVSAGSILANISAIWISLVAISAFIILVFYNVQVKDKTRKNQSKYLTVSLLLLLTIDITTNYISPVLNINFPSFSTLANTLFGMYIAFLLFKNDASMVNPEIAVENIVSAMPDMFVLSDMDNVVLKVNKPLLEFIGITEHDIVNKTGLEYAINQQFQFTSSFGDVEAIIGAKGAKAMLEEIGSKREIRDLEFKLSNTKGEDKTCLLSACVVTNKTGEDIGVVYIIRDITARVQMEQKLVKAERFASIGEFSGMIGLLMK